MFTESYHLEYVLHCCALSQHYVNITGDVDLELLPENGDAVESITFELENAFIDFSSDDIDGIISGSYYRTLPGLRTGMQRKLAWRAIQCQI